MYTLLDHLPRCLRHSLPAVHVAREGEKVVGQAVNENQQCIVVGGQFGIGDGVGVRDDAAFGPSANRTGYVRVRGTDASARENKPRSGRKCVHHGVDGVFEVGFPAGGEGGDLACGL